MKVLKSKGTQTLQGGESNFTGAVWLETVFEEEERIYRVFFSPGARTHWHTHPEGQLLYVLAGNGRVMKAGEPGVEIGPGDVVYFAPDEVHWHGAAPDSFMVHIAINLKGWETQWQGPVTDEDYSQGFD